MTGGELNPPNDLGKTSGNNIIINSKIDDYDDLNKNLYFELVTIDKDKKENIYQLQLTLSEITKNAIN